MQNKTVIVFIVALIIVVGAVVVFTSLNSAPAGGPDYTAFAQCLTKSGAKFYGAFWCPHCAAEKQLFGSAVHALPYVECSTPDANSQTQVCISEGIQEYPTWIFADGTRQTGTLSLQQLSDKTGCPLPAAASSTPEVGIGETSSATSTL